MQKYNKTPHDPTSAEKINYSYKTVCTGLKDGRKMAKRFYLGWFFIYFVCKHKSFQYNLRNNITDNIRCSCCR